MRDTLHKDNPAVPDLELIYRRTLDECRPDALVRRVVTPDMPRNVVAIGKCAAGLAEGFAEVVPVERAFVAVPRGYPQPRRAGWIGAAGGHPQIDADSFHAGEALVKFVDSCDEVVFLISGGGSACVELPLAPWFKERDLIDINARLVDSGLPIAAINTVRKHLSAIKGGRLAARVRGRSVSLIYSDVAAGDLPSVASGPTLPDTTTNNDAAAILRSIGIGMKFDEGIPDTIRALPNGEAILIADNRTLVETAARIAAGIVLREPLEEDVSLCARRLAEHAMQLQPGQLLVAGGEPTVVRRGDGRGGRCSEMALRFAMEIRGSSIPLHALFGSSDGVDGSSGAAGVTMRLPVEFDAAEAADAIGRSDTFPLTARLGRAVIMPPTGNNLRDLYLVARP